MIGKYLRQSFNLLKQNVLFSSFYIVGTGFAIALVMVLAVLYYIKIGEIYPETNRSRMMVALASHMQGLGENNSFNTTWKYSLPFIKDCFYPLEGVEAVTAVTEANSGLVQPEISKRPQTALVKLTDTSFWKVFEFVFIQGKPFTEADLRSGIPAAVVSVDLARRIYGQTDVVGGVVKSPSYAMKLSYADVWLPYSTDQGMMEDNNLDVVDPFQVGILLPDASDADKVSVQVDEYVRKFNLQPHGGYQLRMACIACK